MGNGETTSDEIMQFLQDKMVTKDELTMSQNSQKLELLDAMDNKLGDLKTDLTILMRNEDQKLASLINLLKQKELISEEEAAPILAMIPFPQN